MTRPPVDTPQNGAADPQKPAEALSHQERVYFEMFRAIEQLGRKLEKAEAERFVMSQRLADIEAGAERDETTGRFYLPAKIEPAAVPPSSGAQRLALPAALASLMLAVLTLGAFVMQDMPFKPAAQEAAKTQTAAADFFPPSRARESMRAEWHTGKPVLETVPEKSAQAETAAIAAEEKNMTAAVDEGAVQDAVSLAAAPPVPQQMAEELPADMAVDDVADEREIAAHYADADLESHHAEHAEEDFAGLAALDNSAAPAEAIDDLDVVEVQSVAPPVAVEAFETRLAAVVEGLNASVAAEEAAAEKAAAEKAEEKTVEKPVLLALAAPVQPVPENKAESAVLSVKALPPMMMRDARLPAALQNLEQSAFAGNPEAQHDLASLYAEGRDLPRDYTRARGWYMHAASAGIANAHYNLGVMTQQGLGAAADIPAAYTHYSKAAHLGHPEAMYNIGLMYAEGLGVEKSAVRAAGYFKRAANAGMVQAAYNLGVLYEGNALGKPDIATAIEWYEVAAAEGNRDAALAVRRLSRTKAQAAAGG